MKIGLLGLISSDLSDVDYNKLRFAADLGFHGIGAHLSVHITKTVIGTGMMDLDTVLRRSAEVLPEGYVVIEHLPIGLISPAKRNLTAKIQALGIPLG